MGKIISPLPEAIIYEDKKLYVALANKPITKGHTVVVWRQEIADLHLLKKNDYEYLMNVVDKVRDAIIRSLKVEKVYLVYMDEVRHVHWHLIPRYNEKGFNILVHKPLDLVDVSLSSKIKNKLELAV